MLWELCCSFFPWDFFLWESAQNTHISKSNCNSRRCSPGYFPGWVFFFCFFYDTFISKLDIYIISSVNCDLSLGYVLVWVLKKSKFWAARPFLHYLAKTVLNWAKASAILIPVCYQGIFSLTSYSEMYSYNIF